MSYVEDVVYAIVVVVAFPVMASHIVGGEFELLHVSGNRYRLNMLLYYDAINAIYWNARKIPGNFFIHMVFKLRHFQERDSIKTVMSSSFDWVTIVA